MANLLGQNIGTNYKGILNLNTLNGNLSGTLQAVTDGDGNASPLRLSTTAANINTPFTIGTMSGSVWNVVFDMTTGTNPGGYMNWKLANDATSYYSQFMQGGDMNFFTTGLGYNYGMNFSTSGVSRLRISPTGLIQFGGTTASFPALRVNGTTLEVVLANATAGSGFTGLSASTLTLSGNLFLSSGNAIYAGTQLRIGSGAISILSDSAATINFSAGASGRSWSVSTATSGGASSNAFLYVDGVGTGVTMGGNTANAASALLDMRSTTQGFLPPRMTTAQRDLIATPAAGLMIYNTSTNRPNFYDGSAWVAL